RASLSPSSTKPPKPCGLLRRLLSGLESDDGQRAVQEREPALRSGNGGARARRVVAIALHRLLELLVGELDAADELDPLEPLVLLAGVSVHVGPPVSHAYASLHAACHLCTGSQIPGITEVGVCRTASPCRRADTLGLQNCPTVGQE